MRDFKAEKREVIEDLHRHACRLVAARQATGQAVKAVTIAVCESDDKSYMLCAWCKTWKMRSTGQDAVKLTDEEFERTCVRATNIGHGCCPSCIEKLKAEVP